MKDATPRLYALAIIGIVAPAISLSEHIARGSDLFEGLWFIGFGAWVCYAYILGRASSSER